MISSQGPVHSAHNLPNRPQRSLSSDPAPCVLSHVQFHFSSKKENHLSVGFSERRTQARLWTDKYHIDESKWMLGMYDPSSPPVLLLSELLVCRFLLACPLFWEETRCETLQRLEIIASVFCFYLQRSRLSGRGETTALPSTVSQKARSSLKRAGYEGNCDRRRWAIFGKLTRKAKKLFETHLPEIHFESGESFGSDPTTLGQDSLSAATKN